MPAVCHLWLWSLPTALASEAQLATVHRAVRAGILVRIMCRRAELLAGQCRERPQQAVDRLGLPGERFPQPVEGRGQLGNISHCAPR